MKYLNRLRIASLVIFCLSFSTMNSLYFAQSVGINSLGTAPDASALLDLSSTDKGFLITRVDTINIGAPAFGLMTLSPSDSCLYLFNGNNWVGMGGGGVDCTCNCGDPSAGGGTPPPTCGSPIVDVRDNQTYETVELGSQCWTRENMNYKPSSGNSWCFNNDVANCNIYGRLYDFNTATNSTSSSAKPSGVQGICPDGWHVPSDEEWKEMEMFIGMSQTEVDGLSFRGTNQGDALKATSFGGNNSSGFTGLPGGNWDSGGNFFNFGSICYWWTTTDVGTGAFRRSLHNGRSDIYRYSHGKKGGLSVRCVRD